MNSVAIGLWGALILGLVGSLHCIGMCGPLILALPHGSNSHPVRFWLLRITYHIGRAGTYALFGWLAGTFGHNFKLLGWQQGLSIVGGLLLVALAVWPRLQSRFPGFNFIWLAFRPIQHRFFRQAGFQKQLIAGAFNALLPCGLLYTALAGAVVMGHPLYSALFMGIFGLATVPGLLILSFIKRVLRFQSICGSAHFGTSITLLLGIWMLLRGMGLGIPLLSPDIQNSPMNSVQSESTRSPSPSCH